MNTPFPNGRISWSVGINTALVLAMVAGVFYAGSFAQTVTKLQETVKENEDKSSALGLEVIELNANARATVYRLGKIEGTVEDNAKALRRIEILLGGSRQ